MTTRLADALKQVESRCAPLAGAELVALSELDRRILAEDIVAPISLPSADNSAVDGYGFRHVDLGVARDNGLAVVGVSAAGRPSARGIGRGEAIRILTGAIPPPGVDTIAMQEDVARSGDRIIFQADVALHANLRRTGEDVMVGSTVLPAGRILGPVDMALIASLGLSQARVRRPLRVAILSTGDELVDAGGVQNPGGIFDANRPGLRAMLRRTGFAVTDLGIVPDDPARLRRALQQAAAGHDAILTSAGVSAGDEDHVRPIVETLGGIDFHGVAIKPGRPILAGHIGGIPFFGLPGNPAAALIAYLFIVRPGLLRLAGAVAGPPLTIPVRAEFVLRKREGRREFVRCIVDSGPCGLRAHKSARVGAGLLSSLKDADGFVELDETLAEITPGMTVPFIPLGAFDL
jgi:molybdopterin molybdotransferase